MHLSALRLHGFKSFATVTELKFRPGLTAIVGPNGSGKSNIADAVRWVLGEQSIRALRGTRSQDIIFSGNGRRRPLGLAQVTLELNNEDGLFPLNFSQVSIARKVHRTGEGEFAINGTPCRLRDIHELLTDTGLGRGGFFVVSQGEMNAVLSARPEDRRLLLEEVAGTAGYRMRRKQALDRLEVARADRRRVLDLLDELHRQGDDLRIPGSEEAQRYTALKERLRDVEQRFVRAGWRRWLPAWHKALAELENAQRDLVAGEEELAARERAYEEAAARKEAAEARLLELTDAVHEAERSVAEARHRLEVGGLRLQQLERDDGRLQQRLEEIDGQRAEAEAEAHQAEGRAAAGEPGSGRSDPAGGRVAPPLQRAGAGAPGRRRALGSSAGRGNEPPARTAAGARRHCGAAKPAAGAGGAAAAPRSGVGTLAEYGQWEADVAEAREAAAALEAEAQDLEQAIRRLEKERTARQEQLTAMQQKVRALRRRHDADDARRRALEAMETSGEGYQQGVRRVMARRDLRERGIIGPVGQLLDVEPRWQTAVETALGRGHSEHRRPGRRSGEGRHRLFEERAGGTGHVSSFGPAPHRPGSPGGRGRTAGGRRLRIRPSSRRRPAGGGESGGICSRPHPRRVHLGRGHGYRPASARVGAPRHVGRGNGHSWRGCQRRLRRAAGTAGRLAGSPTARVRELAEGMAAREKELDGLRRDVEAAAPAAEETEATWRETDQRRQKVQAEKTMWQRRIRSCGDGGAAPRPGGDV